jgi:glycosyltransferase involved in cell wall biosynthesis
MKKHPLVTVIITNYNYGKYVTKAAESVLSQTYRNIELLIINDGSTDNSDAVIKKFIKANPGRNIRYVSRKNRGVVYTRNEGMKLAAGEYISYLDADDYFNQDYIEVSLRIAKQSGADVIYPNWHFVGEWLGRPDTDFAEFDPNLLQLQKLHVTPASLIKKSALAGHQFEVEKVAEDWDFFIGLSLAGKSFKLAKYNHINYRIRSGTRSSRNDPREDTAHFVDILEKHRRVHGDRVIEPIRLVKERHPHILKRIFRRGLFNRVLESIKKDGLQRTLVKIARKLLSRVTFIRMIARRLIDARYYFGVDMSRMVPATEAQLAIVIHLYYPELWETISERLSKIKEPFDLYVSVRKEHGGVELGKVSSYHGSTSVMALPNRGRDVLPFLLIAKIIVQRQQYKYILKLHSKKSPHRPDGAVWFGELLDQLIPDDSSQIIRTLKKRDTGIVGPQEHVVSLKRYMGQNKDHIVYVLEKMTNRKMIDRILLNQEKYPFFGGTMFWCTTNFLSPLVEAGIRPSDFSPENRQLDGTIAHGIERLMGAILRDVTKTKVYVITDHGTAAPLPRNSYDDSYKYVG